jgi:hypothetical protein
VPAGYSSLEAYGGLRSLHTGIEVGGPVPGYSSVQQWVTIPTQATEIDLTFWTYPVAEGFETDELDEHYMQVVDEQGDAHEILRVTWPESNMQIWVQHHFDESTLEQFKGQPIALRFQTYNNSTGRSASMYIDEVSLQVCQ